MNILSRHKKQGSPRRFVSAAAFTLIEMLVVIAIISILASMVITAIPGVAKKREISRMRSELKNLETAIEDYKHLYGSYPPDNNMPTTNTLFYELGGVELFSPGPIYPLYTYVSLVDNTALTAISFTNSMKFEGVMNVTSKPAGVRAKPFLDFKSSQYTRVTNGVNSFTILTFATKYGAPGNAFTNQGRLVVPWQYTATRAVHNPGKYDLYATIQVGKDVITVGNWKN